MREVDELINVDDPAWPLLLQELSGTDLPVEVLPGDAETGRGPRGCARTDLGARRARPGRQLWSDASTQSFDPDGTTRYTEGRRQTEGTWSVDENGRF